MEEIRQRQVKLLKEKIEEYICLVNQEDGEKLAAIRDILKPANSESYIDIVDDIIERYKRDINNRYLAERNDKIRTCSIAFLFYLYFYFVLYIASSVCGSKLICLIINFLILGVGVPVLCLIGVDVYM